MPLFLRRLIHPKSFLVFKISYNIQFTGMWNMGQQEGMGTVEYPQVKFRGFFHLGFVSI